MSNFLQWPIRVPLLVDFPFPLDNGDPSTPVVFNADGVLTSIALLPNRKTRLAQDVDSGATTITVEDDPAKFDWANGTTLQLSEFDSSTLLVTVSSVDSAAKTVTFSPSVVNGMRGAARVIEYVEPVITGASYGTPNLRTQDWGWVAEFPSDHSVLQKSQQFSIESKLVSASTGARLSKKQDLLVSAAFRQQTHAAWLIGESLFIDVVAPKDGADPSAPIPIPDTAVAQARVYIAGVESRLADSHAQPFTGSVTLTDTLASVGFVNNTDVSIEADGNLYEDNTINAVTDNTIQLANTTTVDLSAGARVRQIAHTTGDAFATGASYGTFDVTEATGWGFTFEIPFDFVQGQNFAVDPQMNAGAKFIVDVSIFDSASGAKWEQEWEVLVIDPYQEV